MVNSSLHIYVHKVIKAVTRYPEECCKSIGSFFLILVPKETQYSWIVGNWIINIDDKTGLEPIVCFHIYPCIAISSTVKRHKLQASWTVGRGK